MANLEEIVVELVAETSKLRAEMSTATKVTQDSAQKMQDAIKEFTENSAKNTSFFQTSMATMAGFLGSEAVLGVIHEVGDAFKELSALIGEGMDAANKEELAMNKLSTSLALNGQFSQKTAESFREFAGEMEKTTGIADDQIISNAALLSSLTKLDAQGIKQATKSAADLSAAIGIDLDSATRLVAKGIEGNTDAFKRYGITVQQGRTESENFANVMQALSKLNGSAAAQMMTFDGVMKNLKNSFDNAFEAIGRVITNNAALKSVIQNVAKIFQDLESWVNANSDALSKGLSNAIQYVITGMSVFVQVLKVGYEALKTIYDGISLVIEGLGDLYLAEYRLTQLDFKGALDAFNGLGDSAKKVAADVMGETAPAFDSIQDKLYKIANDAQKASDAQVHGFEAATTSIKNQAPVIDDLVTKFYNLRAARQDSTDSFIKGLLDESAAMDSSFKNQQTSTQNAYDLKLIDFQTYKQTETDLLAQYQQQQSDMLLDYYAQDIINEQQYDAAQLALIQQQNDATIKLKKDLKKQEDDINAAKLQGYSTFFGGLSALTESSSKELQSIGKAAAITKATIDAYLAIQNALANVPYPANIAAAAGIGVTAFANVAKIAGIGLAKGIDEVPGIGTQDNFPAVLAPGERVVPSKSNEDLTEFLAQQKNEPKQSIVMNLNFNGIGAITREQAADIITAINDALASRTGMRILNT